MKLRLPCLPKPEKKTARERAESLFAHLDGRCSESCPHCAKGEK